MAVVMRRGDPQAVGMKIQVAGDVGQGVAVEFLVLLRFPAEDVAAGGAACHAEQPAVGMGCDRAKMDWQCGRLQWCWAHLKRDFQALIDDSDHQVKRLGQDLMRPTQQLFRHWSRCRDGTVTRRGFERLMPPIRHEIDSLLLRGVFSGNPRLIGMCRELYGHRDWLWTFLNVNGVDPTNNAAERSLRHAVIWRKLSFGTQSPAGSRFVETLLTTIETCRQKDRSVFEFLTQTFTAHFHNQAAPSLLTDV